jgi:hypothetical protein
MNDTIQNIEKPKKNWYRKVLKIFVIFVFIVFLFFTGSFIYVYTHQEIIKNKLVEYVDKYLKVPLYVDAIDLNFFSHFPLISVRLTNVEIRNEELLYLNYIDASTNIFDIIRGKYIIRKIYLNDGSIKLKIFEDGKTNFDIFVTDTTKKTSAILLELPDIYLKNIHIAYFSPKGQMSVGTTIHKMRTKGKYNDDIFYENSTINLTLDSLIIDTTLSFKNNISINISSNSNIDFQKSIYNAKKITGDIGGNNFLLSMVYNFSTQKPNIDASFTLKKNNIKNIVELLPENIKKNVEEYSLKGTFYLETNIKGDLSNGHYPSLTGLLTLNDVEIKNDKLEFSKINLNAIIKTDNITNISKYKIEINDLQANYGKNSYLKGKLILQNLTSPTINSDIVCMLDLRELAFLNTNNFYLNSGQIQIELKGQTSLPNWYAGYKSFLVLSDINAKLNIQSTNFYIAPYNIKDLNTTTIINNDSLKINSLNCKINEQLIQKANATIIMWKNLFLSDRPYLQINMSAHLSNLVLDSLLKKQDNTKTNASSSQLQPIILANAKINIDNLVYMTMRAQNIALNTQIENDGKKQFVKVDMSTDLIKQKHFSANNIQLNGRMISNKFIIDKIDFKACGGSINGSGYLVPNDKQNDFAIDLIANQLNINQLFREMENFNQKILTDKNINGIASIDLQARGSLTKDWQIIKPLMQATASVNIKNGELINFEPLMGLKKFINRDFANIKFGELSNTLYLSNQIVEIPKMTILSNVININVRGMHTLNNEIDYHLSVKARELLHQSSKQIDYVDDYGYINYDDTKGITLYVRVYGKPGNYKYELFDKEQRKMDRQEATRQEKENIKTNIKEEINIFSKDTSLFIIKPQDNIPKSYQIEWDNKDTQKVKTKTYTTPKKKLNVEWE